MMNDKIKWIKVADRIDDIPFGNNEIAGVMVEDKKICVAKYKNELFAFAYQCPHAGGLLAEGYIDALGNVVCPVHDYKFCLKNGRNVSGEGYHLKHWPVEIRENGVFINFEKHKLFGFL